MRPDRYKWVVLSNTTLGVLISAPFAAGLHTAFDFAVAACLAAAAMSWLRGGTYREPAQPPVTAEAIAPEPAEAD